MGALAMPAKPLSDDTLSLECGRLCARLEQAILELTAVWAESEQIRRDITCDRAARRAAAHLLRPDWPLRWR